MTTNPFGSTTLVDQRFGNVYPIIKSVYEKLAEISYLATNLNDLRPRDVEFRDTAAYVQWRYTDSEVWNDLYPIADFLQLAADALASKVAAQAAAASASAAAVTAATEAGAASGSATVAGDYADAASAAADSANAAVTTVNASASAAATSASSAAGSAAAAAASYESFDDRYLGAKATPPTTDNDGNPLVVGALYWDTVLSPGGTFPASDITFTPAGNVGATTVQAAIVEVDTEKAKKNGDAAENFAVNTLIAVGIQGRVAGVDAPVGMVGEYFEATSSAISLTSNAPVDTATLTLPAGDWEVECSISFTPAGSTMIGSTWAGINTVANTMGGLGTFSSNQCNRAAAGVGDTQVSPMVRLKLTGNTTVRAIANAFFTTSTCTATGFIRARRV